MRAVTIQLPDGLFAELAEVAAAVNVPGYGPKVWATDLIASELASRQVVQVVTPNAGDGGARRNCGQNVTTAVALSYLDLRTRAPNDLGRQTTWVRGNHSPFDAKWRGKSRMSETQKTTGIKMRWTDDSGKEQTREVNYAINIADFRGRAGYIWLLMAANPHLSVADLLRFLHASGETRALRSETWIKTRRWMFKDAGSVGVKPDADGLDEDAFEIMRTSPELSARKLSLLLKQHGIRRGKSWVQMNRCQ